MASFGTSAASKILVLMAALTLFHCMTKITAQDLATPPTPGLETGAGISPLVSGALICSYVLISLVALLY